MKVQLYEEIVSEFKKFKGLSRDCAYMLIHKYPDVPATAIHGIISSEIRLKMMSARGRLSSRNVSYLDKYMTETNRPGVPTGIIVRMSAALNVCPSFLARMILEEYVETAGPPYTRADISKYMKDTTHIDNPRLAHEIYLCILYDDRNGMISDSFCSAVGFEYEVKLENYLQERNIPYLTEENLKVQGYDKTPDIKLEVPIAVNGFVINWIESKARFGTPSIHRSHLNKQYFSYWNRFGPGLVIYWFGFVEELIESIEDKFIILDRFPEDITYMNPLIELDNYQLDTEEES
ncbi:CDAN1-interacting nuclease 1 [Diachasmimorpha longicaudata]|uniref:CDAN1-interacting nuclease 1 n=1 Tax=Diachasmimorpha longicaudata TaxID=58733 RepID=UPI0030B9045C